jgi:hypothetical protein
MVPRRSRFSSEKLSSLVAGRIDRIAEVNGGVPRLVSRPRKKRTKLYLPRGLPLSVWLPKSRNGFVAGLLPLASPEDANAGSSEPNRPLRLGLNL